MIREWRPRRLDSRKAEERETGTEPMGDTDRDGESRTQRTGQRDKRGREESIRKKRGKSGERGKENERAKVRQMSEGTGAGRWDTGGAGAHTPPRSRTAA